MKISITCPNPDVPSPWKVEIAGGSSGKKGKRKFFQTKAKAKKYVKDLEDSMIAGLINPKFAGEKVGLKPAIEEYLVWCEKRNLRQPTLNTYRQRLESFHSDMGDMQIHLIKRGDVKRFAEKYDNKHSRHGHRSDVAGFLNWCGEKGWCDEGKFYKIRLDDILTDERDIPILSPEEAEDLLTAVPDKHKARFALQLFAGLRPFEASQNLYAAPIEIDLKRRRIHLSAPTSKGRRHRTINGFSDNLKAWLEKYPDIEPCSFNAMRCARERHFGKVGHDALRHSFCSYGYWHFGQEKSMRFAGHTKTTTFHGHYIENSVDEKDAEKFFGIFPCNGV